MAIQHLSFKTSKTALQMGVDIDKESGHFLSEIYLELHNFWIKTMANARTSSSW